MLKRIKCSAVEIYQIILEYQDGLDTLNNISCKYKINRRTIPRLIYKFKRYGIDVSVESSTWKK